MTLLDLKISRPGLWFPTVWIYLVPFGSDNAFWSSPLFWIGLLFVTFPLNYLVYGLNDYNDRQADALNPRKGNYLFGAVAAADHLAKIPRKAVALLLPFFGCFIWFRGWPMAGVLTLLVAVNIVYNFPPFRIKERPPFEIFIQAAYVGTAVFSSLLNGLPLLPWQTLVYLSLFAFQAHIAGEIMDIEPDRKAGKKTTAGLIGRRNAKLLMLALLVSESLLLVLWFHDFVLAGILGLFSLWFLLDIFVFFGDKPYTLSQMKLFGYAMNVLALLSMAWLLYAGKLVVV